MREKGWSRPFDDPIPLPGGAVPKTLKEAIAYLAKTVPKAELDMPEVLAAAEILNLRGGAGDRLDVFRAHRYAAGNPPQRSARFQPRSQRHALGKSGN